MLRYDGEEKTASKDDLNKITKITFLSALRIGKKAGISALYLGVIALKGIK